jgi:hypothetical protein
MERTQGARTPYEVYCYHCRVTFPREQRRCVHCGEVLGPPGRVAGLEPSPSKLGEFLGGKEAAGDAVEEPEETGTMLLRRFGGLAVWAVLALVALLSNMCEQGRG